MRFFPRRTFWNNWFSVVKWGLPSRPIRRSFRPTFEYLQSRVVMACDPIFLVCSETVAPDVLWSPDTQQSTIDDWQSQFAALGGFVNNVDASRWTSTATDGGGLIQGHPSTITWSVPPDGTTLGTAVGEANTPSNLRSMLNGLYGSF